MKRRKKEWGITEMQMKKRKQRNKIKENEREKVDGIRVTCVHSKTQTTSQSTQKREL
jgi:hypothetical protein